VVITHNYLVPNVVVGAAEGGGGIVVNKLKPPYPISCGPTEKKMVIFRQLIYKTILLWKDRHSYERLKSFLSKRINIIIIDYVIFENILRNWPFKD
jgi:hypothetical protein